MIGKYMILILPILGLLAGCSLNQSTMQKDHEGDIFPNKIPLGSLRVMQVLNVEKSDVLKDPVRYASFIHNATGFISPYWDADAESQSLSKELSYAITQDSNFEDGYLVVGRVYCCGGVQETVSRQYAFSPVSLPVTKDEFVEVNFGYGKPGDVNLVTRVVNGCSWVPHDPNLWVRIPYCSWMKSEGWIEVSSMITSSNHAWIKVRPKN
ncbi:hypothetical protein KDN34_05670 [Shewanella yunxiaonensis]|uniref:Lipoprotein n=1 Tax=Shewanella yunxiaonensis TaxID=2829809 RepID=A0ABX7YX74_9GAMM|nr:hypothetical protein [Shewanella yunxiaonensis]QUN06931.1 hypothetical protein KDN34_05670 [Shewanella yunxiaonensis]